MWTEFGASVTSQAQYCSPQQALAIDTFALTYFKDNRSIGFDISVRALASPPGATEFNVIIDAYGRTVEKRSPSCLPVSVP
jgi:hypothetical protein